MPSIGMRVTRRQALKAMAAAAAPYVIASAALGGQGRPAPSGRVTMGFIGVGNQGGGHLFGAAWTCLIFVGTEGRIAVDRDALAAYPPKIAEAPLGPRDVHLCRCEGHAANFLDCVRTRNRPC